MRLALRRLRSRPGYTALLILIVGVGIGAATTVFSVVDQLLLRPPPFAYADRLVDVLNTSRATGGGGNNLPWDKIAGWQAQPSLFERFEVYAPAQFDVVGEGRPERITGMHVSVGLFTTLGVAPRLGRDFTPADGRPGAERVVMLSEDLWRRRFGGEPEAIGARLQLNDEAYTIVGVMPRRFHLQADEAVWLPVDAKAHAGEPTPFGFYGIARLAPGVRMPAAQEVADAIADRLQQASPLPGSWDLYLDSKKVASVDRGTTTALFVLLGAVSFVVLITCANVANLFLAHAPLRLREMAIQSALGSSRARLIRSVLLESVLLAAAGGAVAILFARWGVAAVLAAAPERLSFLTTSTIEVDARVIAVAVALTLGAGIAIGLLPALRGSRANVESTLRGGAPGARAAYGRVPAALVVIEVAFSVMLLIGAALMARTMVKLESIEPGFEPRGLIAMHVDLPTDRYATSAARLAFFETLFERLRRIPGVSDAAVATGAPPAQGGFSGGVVQAEGREGPPARMIVPFNRVTPGYFRTLRIPIVAGRDFTDREADDAVIVSSGMADRLWPGENAVGRRFRIGSSGAWRTIVGIVGNVETRAARRERTTLQMYYPWAVRTGPAAARPPQVRDYDWRLLIVRADDPSAALPAIQREIWAMDASQPIEQVALVTDLYAEAFARQRFVLLLMGAFSAIAIALTAAGIFGVLSQVVARRTREIGIRIALGARPADVMRRVLSRGVALTGVGAALGVAGAFWATGALRALLFGISPTDPISFAAVAAFLVFVGLLACWLPARAAMRIDPAVALRVE